MPSVKSKINTGSTAQGDTPSYKPYGYVLPQWSGYPPFWSENGYRPCPFWSGIGYGFQGNYWSKKLIYCFNSKLVRQEEKYASLE